MRAVRTALVIAGSLLLGWGAWLLLTRQDLDQLFSVAFWLAAVVVVHDGSLAAISAVRHRLRARRSRRTDDAREGAS